MSEVRSRQKVTYFPSQVNFRTAPLQEALMEYCVKAFPGRFRDNSDFIRVSITQHAKSIMTPHEFEMVCSRGYEYHPAPVRGVE